MTQRLTNNQRPIALFGMFNCIRGAELARNMLRSIAATTPRQKLPDLSVAVDAGCQSKGVGYNYAHKDLE